ncbi:hypothetical protein ANO11243_095390 [Dothideomycetidae sp. 11243]|nr:hypothetical protein ANO11243_095390 [fungal sp. No.11243]
MLVQLGLLAALPSVIAQFPPPRKDITTLESKFHPGVTISFKEPGICETTPGVRSYSGYVHLPAHSLNEKHENQSYPINTFFWFFEARKDPHNAPLSIWLNGGPGGSSLMGALSENGPCFIGKDSNSTYLNPWSWNKFPAYKPNDNRISIYGESYGGRYVPQFIDFFLKQNEKIRTGEMDTPGAHYIHLDTMGIVNGCIDFFDQVRGYIEFAWKNTYGIRMFTEAQYHNALYHYHKDDGMKDRIAKCIKMERELDPHDHGDVEAVNEYCKMVNEYATNYTILPMMSSGKYGWFDITHELRDSFPPQYLQGYLNQAWVQEALGVPVNFSASSEAVYHAFVSSGDMAKGDQLGAIAYALDHGIKTHLVYGDRDYACNWVNGEYSSLNIPWKHQKEFAEAGYTAFVAAKSPYLQSHGLTRQYGNLSFTRVYQSGHLVPSYQGEAAYKIFMRSLFNKDIATGTIDTAKVSDYSTYGHKDTWWMKSDVLPRPPSECYVLAPDETCNDEELKWIRKGEAIVENWIVVGSTKKSKSSKSEREGKAFASARGRSGQAPLGGGM